VNLCTLGQLKIRLGIAADDTGSDDLLNQIIAGVSGALQGAAGCGRDLAMVTDLVETISAPEPRTSSVWTSARPIVSISEIKEALYGDFDAASALVENEGYQYKASAGELVRIGWWLRGVATIRVTYTAGYVAPGDDAGAGETALPDEIVEAALIQCAFVWQKKDKLGMTAAAAAGGSASGFAPDKLLPGPRETMRGYRRYA